MLDYRRYVMPVKPYTLAARFVHLAQYGRDAGDPRVPPTFLGSRYFVRGYGWSDITCQWDSTGNCAELEALLGNRLVATSVEVRAPLVRHVRTRHPLWPGSPGGVPLRRQ